MTRFAVVYFLTAGDALSAAVLGGEGKQRSLGRLMEKLGVTHQYRSCEETYGVGMILPFVMKDTACTRHKSRTAAPAIAQLWGMYVRFPQGCVVRSGSRVLLFGCEGLWSPCRTTAGRLTLCAERRLGEVRKRRAI